MKNTYSQPTVHSVVLLNPIHCMMLDTGKLRNVSQHYFPSHYYFQQHNVLLQYVQSQNAQPQKYQGRFMRPQPQNIQTQNTRCHKRTVTKHLGKRTYMQRPATKMLATRHPREHNVLPQNIQRNNTFCHKT